jgi:hypothetical protein
MENTVTRTTYPRIWQMLNFMYIVMAEEHCQDSYEVDFDPTVVEQVFKELTQDEFDKFVGGISSEIARIRTKYPNILAVEKWIWDWWDNNVEKRI